MPCLNITATPRLHGFQQTTMHTAPSVTDTPWRHSNRTIPGLMELFPNGAYYGLFFIGLHRRGSVFSSPCPSLCGVDPQYRHVLALRSDGWRRPYGDAQLRRLSYPPIQASVLCSHYEAIIGEVAPFPGRNSKLLLQRCKLNSQSVVPEFPFRREHARGSYLVLPPDAGC